MPRRKGTSTPRDDRERIDQAKDTHPTETQERNDQAPRENEQEWWRKEGDDQGEVY